MAQIIGIAGTAKNTGKTTTTAKLIDQLVKHGMTIGLTSIGYDGEEIDNVTGLPKPRLDLPVGSLVATTDKCVRAGTARLMLIAETKIVTPLGRINYYRVDCPGLVVIAGPNKARDVQLVTHGLTELGAEKVLVDGALNRILPMTAADALILATGAARNHQVEILVEETIAFWRILNLPEAKEVPSCPGILVETEATKRQMPLGSLLDQEQVQEIVHYLNAGPARIVIPGFIPQHLLGLLLQSMVGAENKQVVFGNSYHLLVGGNPLDIDSNISRFLAAGGQVGVIKRVPLILVTINPFYPAYSHEENKYCPGHIDGDTVLRTLRERLNVPVVDVLKEGIPLLAGFI